MFQVVARIIERGTLLTGRPADMVRKAQLSAMHEATQLGVRRVKERTPQGLSGAQGGLISTIEPEVRESRTRVVGTIGTNSPYGLVAEKGRRPGRGMPPVQPLQDWVAFKFGVEGEELERLTHIIRWKIAKKGTDGAHMFERTMDEDWLDFRAIFDRYGVTISRELQS